jgi:hypothetical protein
VRKHPWITTSRNDCYFALEVDMSEEDLELLITTDDPGEDDLEEDTFHHLQAENIGHQFTAGRLHDQRTEVVADSDRSK